VRDFLEQHPSARLHVFAIWLPMLATDARSEWDEGVLADGRVTHYWDGERIAGTWLAERNVGDLGASGIVWDAFLVFGAEAAWGTEPGPLRRAGAPVIEHAARLRAALLPLLDQPS
jgi:hypothetical protein